MAQVKFVTIAEDLELAGLFWKPEIGDEVAERTKTPNTQILVDPKGMTPAELRVVYLWLPNVEQMIFQLEARQALLSHCGIELCETFMGYRTVIHGSNGVFESKAESLRLSVGIALRNMLLSDSPVAVN